MTGLALALWAALGCRPPSPPPTPTVEPAPPSPPEAPAHRDALYFALVDRFADGAPNDDGTVAPDDPQGWHGGDVRGVLDHLDHLETLGVGAVWLSPLSDCQDDKVDAWGAFHCYWVDDLGKAEPRLGTLDDVATLSEALHARGMRLYLDMVYNHVGYTSPLREAHPDWFHGLGDVQDWSDPVQVVTHDVHGLPDLAQERDDVYAHLRAQSEVWIEAVDPDGIRVDAVRHLPEGFLARLGDDLEAVAGHRVQLLGEVFEGNAEVLAARQRADRLDRVFDFPLHYAMKDTFCEGRSLGRLASILSMDRVYDDPSTLVTFLDNHDVSRIQSACGDDDDKVEAALAFQLTARGSPSLTWGTEVGLDGAEEPDNRKDMPWDAVAGHPRMQLVSDLLDLRATTPALHSGSSRLLVSPSDDVLRVLRQGERDATVVVVNRSDAPVDGSGLPDGFPSVASAWAVVDGVLQRGLDAVPAGAVGGLVLDAGGVGEPPDAEPVEVALSVQAELAEGEELVLVGAGSELGSWSAAQGLEADDDGVFRVTVPRGTVLAFKLVARSADGERWEERPDRYVQAGAGPHGPLVWGE